MGELIRKPYQYIFRTRGPPPPRHATRSTECLAATHTGTGTGTGTGTPPCTRDIPPAPPVHR
ncbi:hypothetical protein GCM10020229_06830 [Kitasatospora albolonga]